VIRELELLGPADLSLLTERRRHAPQGAAGGGEGKPGRNLLNDQTLPAKTNRRLAEGDVLRIETPGGGGWGR
jgi:N-methylhydantoinase B